MMTPAELLIVQNQKAIMQALAALLDVVQYTSIDLHLPGYVCAANETARQQLEKALTRR